MNPVATVDANGLVTSVAAGTATISYTVTNSCGGYCSYGFSYRQ
ncbi:MAG: Ig-like domain-containing protein [Bacteroidota bacterium]